ncbi:MAG: hypothetical protein D6732_10780 [Methanobacteriota archaeon]|nr:MAG: hypothetical protein D6732_10780 [Euryarchaeota archaeon]
MKQELQERDIQEIFRQDVRQANFMVDLLFILASLAVTAGLAYTFSDYIHLFLNQFESTSKFADSSFLIGAVVAFVPVGYIMGFVWTIITRILLRILYINPIKAVRDGKSDFLQLSGIMARVLFSENLEKAFLRLEAPDLDYRKLWNMLKFSRRFVITYLSLFYIALYYILDIFRKQESDDFFLVALILGAMLIAFVVTGLYLPMNLVIEDARVLVMEDNGQMIPTKVDLFDYIDRFLVFSGLVLGYFMLEREFIYRNILVDQITLVLVYVIFSILIVVLIAPAFYPAILVYRNMHSKLVNNFREALAKAGVQIAKINRFAAIDFVKPEEILGGKATPA